MSTQTLKRTAFTTSRLMEFFTEKELSMQIGHNKEIWPTALLKELIDNALDACENTGISPRIEVTVEADSLSVRDNGPGLPVTTLEKSLDYLVRVSDKNHYISPSRGQLGNALKCVWAAPFVADGGFGRVEVITGGHTHRIDVTLDRLAQSPQLDHTLHPDGLVKNGTFVKMHWPGIAGYLDGTEIRYFYNRPPLAGALVQNYSLFNPHATLTYTKGEASEAAEPTDTAWRKWQPGDPTSPHWYSEEQLRALIAAYVSGEREGNEAKTVRAFVSEFAGLSGTAKQKQVARAAGLSGAYLHDLVSGSDIDRYSVARLLDAMRAESRPIKPAALGAIGKDHVTGWLSQFCDPGSVRYKAIAGNAGNLPFLLEVALAYFSGQNLNLGREVVTGLNWSPALSIPFPNLSGLLGEYRLDRDDPVICMVHLACPRLNFTDRGKSQLNLPDEISDALATAFKSVASEHKRAKRQADRNDKLRQSQLEELRKAEKSRKLSIKQAAYRVMEQAYMHASANNTLPANARQIMYAARPLVLELTGGNCWKNSSYFTQHLLPDYIDKYSARTESWDVVYDARGKLIEPHTGIRIDLGTLAVRRYAAGWTGETIDAPKKINLSYEVQTRGPTNRYRFALFIEKEGFNELFEAVGLANRYDLATFSTKGMSTTAGRALVAELSKQGVTILVLHDFDKSGLTIAHTLKSNTRRWQYETEPNIIDLGLRLADVLEMDLQSERDEYRQKIDPRINLGESGAGKEECDYLVRGGRPGAWWGERVELNAMTSEQFIGWLERKLEAAGVAKFVPSEDTLKQAYTRAVRMAEIQRAIDKAIREIENRDVSIPLDLAEQVSERLKESDVAWDDVIFDLARG